jgi:hypothetical protein
VRPDLTPCLICEKAVLYLWKDEKPTKDATNLNGASNVKIFSWYGSVFDANEYHAVICDDCLDNAIQSKRVIFIKEHPLL